MSGTDEQSIWIYELLYMLKKMKKKNPLIFTHLWHNEYTNPLSALESLKLFSSFIGYGVAHLLTNESEAPIIKTI